MYTYPKLDEAKAIATALGLPIPQSSQCKNKKLYVVYNGKQIHFGSRSNSDFLQHKDENRRQRYHARADKIKLKDGSFAVDNMMSPAFWSKYILWT